MSTSTSSRPVVKKSKTARDGFEMGDFRKHLDQLGLEGFNDVLVKLSIDPSSGHMVMLNDGLELVLDTMGKTIASQKRQLQALQDEFGKIQGKTQAIEEISKETLGRVGECQEQVRLSSYQVSLMTSKAAAGAPSTTAAHRNSRQPRASANAAFGPPQVTRVDLAQSMKELEDEVQECMADQESAFDKKLAELAERLETLESQEEEEDPEKDEKRQTLLDDIDVRLVMSHDEVMGVKADLSTLQKSIKESLLTKAEEADLVELRTTSHKLLQESRQVQVLMAEANENMDKFDLCLKEAEEAKLQTRELAQLFKRECQEIRDWTTTGLSELKTSIMEKIDPVKNREQLEKFRKELREGMRRTIEVSERCQVDVRKKAGLADVLRLQEEVADLQRRLNTKRQLLIGTRCMSCDQPIIGPQATDEGPVDVAKRRLEENLLNEVENILHESPAELRMVAMRLGSHSAPKNISRSDHNSALGGDGLSLLKAPDTARPSTTSTARRIFTHSPNLRDADMPERFPPREAQPLVRIVPQTSKGWTPPDGPRRGSLLQALGPLVPP
jgi:hypothetical protein